VQTFWLKESLEKHQEWCLSNNGVAMIFPKPEDKIKFNSNHCKMRVLCVMHADFECFTKPADSCEPKPQESYTQEYQQSEPSGFGYYIVTAVGDCNYKSYTKRLEDENVGQIFVENIENKVRQLRKKHKLPKPIKLTPKENLSFQEAKICHICEKE